MRRARLGVVVCTFTLSVSPSAAADDRPPPYYIAWSTTPMTRNADAFMLAARLVNLGTDVVVDTIAPGALTPKNLRGASLRAAKLIALDVPLTTFAYGLNHEYGHITRARQIGLHSRFRIVGSPWSKRYFDLAGEGPVDLGTIGGGFEASTVITQRTAERWYRDGQARVSDVTILLLGALELPLYARHDLSESALSRRDEFFAKYGDPSDYVEQWMFYRHGIVGDEVRIAARAMRRASWMNLVDWTFLTGVRGLAVDHVWNGKRSIPARWLRIGTLQIAPGLRYHLSPVGPERYASVRLRHTDTSGTAYFRWTEPVGGRRLVGVGGSWTVPATFGVRPRVAVDVWSERTGKRGMRGEVAAETMGWPTDRAVLTLAAGAKTRGYILGFPLDPGPYVSLGMALRFD